MTRKGSVIRSLGILGVAMALGAPSTNAHAGGTIWVPRDFINGATGKCLEAKNQNEVQMATTCNRNPNQVWSWNEDTGKLQNVGTGRCLRAGFPAATIYLDDCSYGSIWDVRGPNLFQDYMTIVTWAPSGAELCLFDNTPYTIFSTCYGHVGERWYSTPF